MSSALQNCSVGNPLHGVVSPVLTALNSALSCVCSSKQLLYSVEYGGEVVNVVVVVKKVTSTATLTTARIPAMMPMNTLGCICHSFLLQIT